MKAAFVAAIAAMAAGALAAPAQQQIKCSPCKANGTKGKLEVSNVTSSGHSGTVGTLYGLYADHRELKAGGQDKAAEFQLYSCNAPDVYTKAGDGKYTGQLRASDGRTCVTVRGDNTVEAADCAEIVAEKLPEDTPAEQWFQVDERHRVIHVGKKTDPKQVTPVVKNGKVAKMNDGNPDGDGTFLTLN